MRVNIGKYVHWYTTTRIENAYLEWRYKKYSWEIDDSDHDWIDKTVMRILDVWQNVLHYTINRIQSRREQKIRVHVDPWDTWSADYTLAHVILPVLEQLRDTNHGYFLVDPKDVPRELKPTKKELDHYRKTMETDSKAYDRYEWVMNEMIFAFRSKVKDEGDWENEATLKRIQNGFELFGKYYNALWD